MNVGEVVELLPNGSNVEVTYSNRLEYLRLLRERIIDNITKQVDRQFQQFYKGLAIVVNPKFLKRFTADELRDIVEGASHFSGKYTITQLTICESMLSLKAMMKKTK